MTGGTNYWIGIEFTGTPQTYRSSAAGQPNAYRLSHTYATAYPNPFSGGILTMNLGMDLYLTVRDVTP